MDAGLLGVAFCYAHDRLSGASAEDKVTVPLGIAEEFAPRVEGVSGRSSPPQPAPGLKAVLRLHDPPVLHVVGDDDDVLRVHADLRALHVLG